MDVRCDRCSTEYQLDEGRITEAGVAVKCSQCGHLFVVRKKAAVVTEPVRSPAETPAGRAPPVDRGSASDQRTKEWKVRQANGNLITFQELTTLQKWIVERKVSREDEISLTGETWKRLGSVPDLSSFFQVVDEARQAAQFLERPLRDLEKAQTLPKDVPEHAQTPPQELPSVVFSRDEPVISTRMPPTNPSEPAKPSAPFEDFAFPKPIEDRPAPRRARHDSIEELAAALKSRSNAGLSIAILLLLLGAVSYLGYRYFVWIPERQRQVNREALAQRDPAVRERVDLQEKSPRATDPVSTPVEPPSPPKVAEPGKAPGEAAPLKATEPTSTPVGAASPPKAAEAGSPPPLETAQSSSAAGASAKAPAKTDVGGDFDSYMSKGDRLREREQPRSALQAYVKAIELEPMRPEPLAGRGLALLDLGRTAPAIAAFEQALKIDPRYGLALIGLAEAYRAEGNKDRAVRYYEKYLAVLPNGPEAQVAKAAIKALQE